MSNPKMVLKIRRRSQPEWLISYILVMPFAFYLLMGVLHLPSVVKYTIDIAWLLLALFMLTGGIRIKNLAIWNLLKLVGVLFASTLVGTIFEYQSVLYYLWGFRNNFRFFVFFFACIFYLKRDKTDNQFALFDGLFMINLALTVFQFLVLGLRQDFLGGLFGTDVGCNSYTNLFLLIVTALHLLRYMNALESFGKCILYCGLSILLAALTEIKAFYVEIGMVLALAAIMTRFSIRKVIVVLVIMFAMVIGINVIEWLFPKFADWFNLQVIWETVTSKSGYTGSGDMNRLTAIGISLERFLKTWTRKLFGLGLGNCDYAEGYGFLTSPFYREYGKLHYKWFSSAFMLLETGLIGLGLYVYFFIRIYQETKRLEKQATSDVVCCQLSRVMALMSIVLIIYNSSLRTEAGYMLYYILALPFIGNHKATV